MITIKNLVDRKDYLKKSVDDLLDGGFYTLRGLAKELKTYPRKIKEMRDGKVTKKTEVDKFIKLLGLK